MADAASTSSSASKSSAEWDLITLSPQASSSSSLCQGELSPSFHTQTAQSLLAQYAGSSSSLPTSLKWDHSSSPFDAIQLASAALAAFVQLNWTGPAVPEDIRPANLLRWANPSAFPPRSVQDNDEAEATSSAELEARLRSQALDSLTCEGEPAYHLCEQPIYLVIALDVLKTLSRNLPVQEQPESLPWWTLRAASIHNRILDTAVPLPGSVLAPVDALLEKLASRAASASADATSGPSSLGALHARLLLERGLALSRVGQDKEANEYFVKAGQASGLKYELTGALGKKTKFQKEEKTILVVLAESTGEVEGEDGEAKNGAGEGEEAALLEGEDEVAPLPSTGWKAAPASGQRSDLPANYQLNDDTLLEQTRFTSNSSSESISHRDPANQPPLAPLDQAVLLALSLAIRNAAPEHGLTTSQISAFVARVAQHPRNWSVYTMALLLRSRLEATRTRTAERAVLQLQALLDQMPTSDSTSQERLRYFYQLDLPPKWELQAELAKRYATLGVLRSALEIFEKIELWEEVVHMLGSMGRQEEGIEVIQDLLSGKKVEASQAIVSRKSASSSSATTASVTSMLNTARQAKLWCLLGDLQPAQAEAHYTKAWELSGRRSARAARSLGGLYFSQALPDYGLVVSWLHRALKISSLMARSWFMLGCAYMRREEWGKAARSFRRTTAIDEEDGEAWNNLASCYLRMVTGATVEDIEADDPEMEEQGHEENESDGSGNESDRTLRTDSGVELSSSDEAHAEDGDDGADGQASRREVLTPFVLKTLAHRCLRHALRHNPDSWKVWSNYMIVSVDVGEMNEACRSLAKVVQLKSRSASSGGGSGRIGEEDVDWQVLDRLVDAVIRSPGQTVEEVQEEVEEEKRKAELAEGTQQPQPAAPQAAPTGGYEAATSGAVSVPVAAPMSMNSLAPPAAAAAPPPSAAGGSLKGRSPNEGRGLYPSLLSLLTSTLLPALSHPRLHRAHARLLLWSREYSQALEAHLAAFRSSPAGDAARLNEVAADLSGEAWREAVLEVRETCEAIETLSARMDKEKEGRFKARSLLRNFMARFKDWEESKEWEELLELKEELK